MQVVPVIDIQAGQVVRAVGGRRDLYRPLTSRLTNATDPVDVACAIRDRHALSEIYVADLDAIAGAEPARDMFEALRSNGFRIWVDAGVRTTQDAIQLAGHVDAIVLGLETLEGPHVIEEVVELVSAHRPCLIFSLDLRDGQSLGDAAAWGTADPLAIAHRAIAAGITQLIVLDLAHIGGSSGLGTESLCAELVKRVQVFAGGGVRNREDLRRLEAMGISGALVASAIHDGVDFG